jgi:hypothetical protein
MKLNRTMYKLSAGMMKWKRRINIPMWHPSHVSKAANILRQCADKLDRIEKSNSMRGSDRTMLAQQFLVEMNQDFSLITPRDPRERGAEHYEFINSYDHMTNTNGFDDLAKRKELNEDN